MASQYEKQLPKVMTTFYLPDHHLTGLPIQIERNKIVLPYDCIQVVERWSASPEVRTILGEQRPHKMIKGAEPVIGIASTIFWNVGDEIAYGTKVVYSSPTHVKGRMIYEPEYVKSGPHKLSDLEDVHNEALSVLDRFLTYLENRDVRYIEEATSRQVRKAMGVSKDYREYIVIPKEKTVRYANAIRRTEMVKRLTAFHAVRGHARTYKADRYVNVKGKTAFIKPFTRGNIGDAVQVKDYRVQQ